MHRRTYGIDEVGMLEDAMLQSKHTMHTASGILAGCLPQEMLQLVGGTVKARSRWLPGPYPALSFPNVSNIWEFEGPIRYSFNNGGTPDLAIDATTITIYSPLSLVQQVELDSTAWGVIGVDSSLLNIVGRLLADWTYDFDALYPATPGSGWMFRQIVIAGKVEIVDSAPESVSYYNSAAPTVPITAPASKERQAVITLDVFAGTPVALSDEPQDPNEPVELVTVPTSYLSLASFNIGRRSDGTKKAYQVRPHFTSGLSTFRHKIIVSDHITSLGTAVPYTSGMLIFREVSRVPSGISKTPGVYGSSGITIAEGEAALCTITGKVVPYVTAPSTSTTDTRLVAVDALDFTLYDYTTNLIFTSPYLHRIYTFYGYPTEPAPIINDYVQIVFPLYGPIIARAFKLMVRRVADPGQITYSTMSLVDISVTMMFT